MIRALRILRRIGYLHLAYAVYNADRRRLTRARLTAFARGVVTGATRTHETTGESYLGEMDPEFYAQQVYNANKRNQ